MQAIKETIGVLNDLVQINNDRIVTYEKAIRQTKTEDTDMKILYASMVAEGHRIRITLATEIQALGAEIEQGTSTSGSIYRGLTEVIAIFAGHNRQTILANCLAGEEAIQKAYHLALTRDLPLHIRELLIHQQETLLASLDEIASRKDQYA